MAIIDRNAVFFEGPLTADARGPAGALTALPGAAWTVAGAQLALGARLGPRFLPQGVHKPWLRLNFTLTPQSGKSVSAGRLFAALLREEDMPYEPALQVK